MPGGTAGNMPRCLGMLSMRKYVRHATCIGTCVAILYRQPCILGTLATQNPCSCGGLPQGLYWFCAVHGIPRQNRTLALAIAGACRWHSPCSVLGAWLPTQHTQRLPLPTHRRGRRIALPWWHTVRRTLAYRAASGPHWRHGLLVTALPWWPLPMAYTRRLALCCVGRWRNGTPGQVWQVRRSAQASGLQLWQSGAMRHRRQRAPRWAQGTLRVLAWWPMAAWAPWAQLGTA